MDKDGFKKYLTDRDQPIADKEIIENIKMVEKFEEFLTKLNKTLQTAGKEEFEKFSRVLIEEKINTYTNFAALSRYAYFIENIHLFLSVLEIFDGAEVMNVLRERLGEHVGDTQRDKILPNESLPPLGMSNSEKPIVTQEVMKRMRKLDSSICETVLADVAHGLPRDFRKGERDKFLKAGDIDAYLKEKRENAIAELEKHRDEGTLFFNQYITNEVVEFVKNRPDILSGERRGNIIYHTKIPYLVQEYLDATDDKMKRYYACHCAWARESILSDDVEIDPTFCYCSGGFTKQPWEAALDRKLEVKMEKSVLKGDLECSFIIPLPDDVLNEPN